MDLIIPFGYLLVRCLFLNLMATIASADTSLCPGVAKRTGYYLDVFNGTCYMFVGKERHWDEAQSDCWGMGGELLSIKSMETMNYIKKKLYSKELGWSNNGVWNGASNLRDRGWEWTTGEKLTFKYWADGEPSKLFGFLSVENCACMRRAEEWRWHDYHCHAPGIEYKYICQFGLMHKQGKFEHISGNGPTPAAVRDDTGALIGLAVGAVVLVVLLVTALYLLYRKHERQKAQYRDPTVRLQTTGYATIITHQETANSHDSDTESPIANGTRPVSNIYLDPMEVSQVYEEVPKDNVRVVNRPVNGEATETTHLVYTGAAAAADDADGGYLSATASEASGATSGYCSNNTVKKVGDGDYVEMNGANGFGPVHGLGPVKPANGCVGANKVSNEYVGPVPNGNLSRNTSKSGDQEEMHIYTNQLESAYDEVGYLRPLPPVPCGIQPSTTKQV